MKRLVLVLLTLTLAGSTLTAGPRVRVGPVDWFDFRPHDPLVPGFYLDPYNDVIRVDEVVLITGERVLRITALRGNPCGTDLETLRPRPACVRPMDSPRRYWFPVEVTFEPVTETR